MNMVRKRSLAIFVFVAMMATCLILACTKSWYAVPDPYAVEEYEHCKTFAESPQLIFIPGFGKASILVDDCDRYRREKVAIAMQTFESSWHGHFGRNPEMTKILRELVIVFNQDVKRVRVAFDTNGQAIDSPTLSGETIGKSMIWVQSESQRICDTSFVHELVHISLWAVGYDRGDPDHLGNSYPGWTTKHELLIQEVNQTLCVLGI